MQNYNQRHLHDHATTTPSMLNHPDGSNPQDTAFYRSGYSPCYGAPPNQLPYPPMGPSSHHYHEQNTVAPVGGGFMMPTPGFPTVPGFPMASNLSGSSYPVANAPKPPPSPQSYNPSYAPPAGILPQSNFGAAPAYSFQPSSTGFLYLGTTIPPPLGGPYANAPHVPSYDPSDNVEKIRNATKGFGTDENALITVFSTLDALQVDALCKKFEVTTGKSFVGVIDKETRSWFQLGLKGIAVGPVGWDAELVKRAIDGIGTYEDLLNEVLLCRTNEELQLLKGAYRARYNHNLEDDVKNDLSGQTERLFNMVLMAQRVPDNTPVDHTQVESDVQALFKASQGKAGTDEIAFCHIMTNRSQPHLAALSSAYHQKHKTTLTKVIKREFSGHMKVALLFIAEGAKRDGQGIHRDAKLMEKAMAGLGTKDERLVWRIVRAHWDRRRMEAIKQAYQNKYKKSLASRVIGETSGDYRKLMLALIDRR